MASEVLQKAHRDLIKVKNGESLDPSFIDNASFQDSCIVDDYSGTYEETLPEDGIQI